VTDLRDRRAHHDYHFVYLPDFSGSRADLLLSHKTKLADRLSGAGQSGILLSVGKAADFGVSGDIHSERLLWGDRNP
jgi:hypothetical protein